MLFLSGCSNAYLDFYSGSRFQENSKHCIVAGSFYSSQKAEVVANMNSQGMEYIGWSAFQSGDKHSQSEAQKACDKVGADVVVVMVPEYLGSQTVAYQTQQYHPSQPYYQSSTTNYNGTANYSGSVYGQNGGVNFNGTANGSGQATTTTFGMTPSYTTTETNYATVHRYNYGAMYFRRKMDRKSTGLNSVVKEKKYTYTENSSESETRDDYAECFRSVGYVESEDVCSGLGSAEDGLLYWNPQKQACLKYNRYSSHVKEFCNEE
jgi:hypothetical protein